MPDRALSSVQYQPVATVDVDDEDDTDVPRRHSNGNLHLYHVDPPAKSADSTASRGSKLAVPIVVSLSLLCLFAWAGLRAANASIEWPFIPSDDASMSGWLSLFSPASATTPRSASLTSFSVLSRATPTLPSELPASVSSLRSCLQSHRTGRVIVSVVSSSASLSVSNLLLDANSSDVSPWCMLLLAQSADVTYTVPASDRSTVTFVGSSDQTALPYVSVSSSSSTSPSYIRNVAYLLAMHAGASFIVDGDEEAENRTLSTLHYRASTFPLGDSSARFTHCQPAVQIVSSLLPSSAAPSLLSSYYALNIESDFRLRPQNGKYATTAIMSPFFPLLWLPPSLPFSASSVIRALAAIPVSTFLQVPTIDTSLVRSDHPPTAAVRSTADQRWSDDSGPSPAQLNQTYIQPCVVHATSRTQAMAAPTTDRPSASASTASFASNWQAVPLLSLLRSVQRGYANDIQLALRDQLTQEPVSTDEAVRVSLQMHALIEQLYSLIALSDSTLIRADDLQSLRAFQDDVRAIRAAVTAQLLPQLVPATALALPRQERVSVCVMFNDPPYWHSLYTALHQHTALSRHVILSTPNATKDLDERTRQLLASYPDVTAQRCESVHGYYQHNCLLQCLLQVRRDRHATRGVLWVADDLFFNVSQLFYYPQRWNVDEFWTHSRNYLMNITAPWSSYHGAFGVQWHHWVTGIDFHARLQQSYLAWPQQYRDALDSVYGKGRLATEALSDVLYVPVADGQMDNMIDVLSVQASFSIGPWCETFTTVAIDIATILAGRRPNLPIWPFIDQQLSLYNVRPLDGVKRWIDGMQLYPANNVTETNLLYNFFRRGAALTVNSTDQWTAEMDSLITHNRTAAHYAVPTSQQYQLGGCDADYTADGYPSVASLRPIPIRPECHLADTSTPQRKDWALVRLCAESEGAGWVHPIKVGHRHGERTMLSLEFNQRVMVAVHRLLLEGDWTDGRWCERHGRRQQQEGAVAV